MYFILLQFLDATTGVPHMGDPKFRAYTVIVSGLRMATNYSFEVQPKETRRTRFYVQNQSWIQNPSATRVVVQTKGCKFLLKCQGESNIYVSVKTINDLISKTAIYFINLDHIKVDL